MPTQSAELSETRRPIRSLTAHLIHRVRKLWPIQTAPGTASQAHGASSPPATSLGVRLGVDVEPPEGRATESGRLPELRRLILLARSNLSSGTRPWLAAAIGGVALVVYLLLRDPSIAPVLWHAGAVYASLPFTTELGRLPMSLFLPTPYLPIWGAVGQIIIVIGFGELLLGRRLTIAVASIGHLVATLTARAMIELAHGGLLGLSPALAHVLDTGPSAAVTAVGACLLVVLRMNRCAAVLCVALLIAAAVSPGIDGLEHLVALGCGILAGITLGHRRTESLRRRWSNVAG